MRYILHQCRVDDRILFHHDGFEFNDGDKPAHDFSVEERVRRYAPPDKIVYLERDPRDVIVSLFHQVTGRFDDFFAYRGSLSDFIRDPYFGLDPLLAFQSMWRRVAAATDCVTIRYEDLHEGTEREVRRILAHFKLDVAEDQLEAALAGSTLEAMRAVEAAERFGEPWLRPRLGHAKVRKGRVGSHSEEMSAADIEYCDQKMAQVAEVSGLGTR